MGKFQQIEVLVRVSWKVDLGSSGYRLFGGFLFVLQLLLQHDKNFLNNFEQKFTYLFNLAASLFLHLKTSLQPSWYKYKAKIGCEACQYNQSATWFRLSSGAHLKIIHIRRQTYLGYTDPPGTFLGLNPFVLMSQETTPFLSVECYL